jgi:hypothetical protein
MTSQRVKLQPSTPAKRADKAGDKTPPIRTSDRSEPYDGQKRAEWALLLGLSTAVAVIHLLTNSRYGFHPDELQFLSDARHLDWGFVPYPPLTPFLGRISLAVFGVSVAGVRVLPVLAQAAAIFVTGLMTKELGGGRRAQLTAALCVALSPIPVIYGTQLQYSCFDFLWWVLIAWFTIRLLKSEDPRWWLAIGAVVGIGLETKYSVVFLVAGILCGLAFSQSRRFFASVWFWGGCALALALFLPNLLWLARHDFITDRFLQTIHERDVAAGNTDGFLLKQILLCVNPVALPIWLTGLIGYLRSSRYRMLAWMYLIPLALFYVSAGRSYYLAPAYPMLLAMGSVAAEAWIAGMGTAAKTGGRKTTAQARRSMRLVALAIAVLFFAGLALEGVQIYAVNVPFQSSGRLRDYAVQRNADFQQEFGWDEMVRTVAEIRDSLRSAQKANPGVLVDDYAEQGAIEILGPAWHLPPPISLVNSGWLRGYPPQPPASLIVLGFSQRDANDAFTGCTLAGHITNSAGVKNQESKTPDIFVCGPPRLPWPVFWADHQIFN